jgi:hypothetical protein
MQIAEWHWHTSFVMTHDSKLDIKMPTQSYRKDNGSWRSLLLEFEIARRPDRTACVRPEGAEEETDQLQPVLAPNPYPTEWQACIRRCAWRVLFRNAPYLHSLFTCMQNMTARSREHRLLITSFLRLVRRGERRRGEGECKYTACFLGRGIRSPLDWWIVCAVQKKEIQSRIRRLLERSHIWE